MMDHTTNCDFEFLMWIVQETKREMVASAFGEGQSGSSVTSLSAQDLKYLFMGAH